MALPAPDPALIQALTTAWAHQQGNYKFQTASYALYCYDHLLVLSDEIDRIWTGRFTLASLLYILNRYMTHVQFIAIQVGFYEHTWSSKRCDDFVKFPGASTTAVFGIAEITMILRMYALYGKNKWVLGGLSTVLVAQVTVMAVCVSTGVRVPFPPGFPGCVLTGTVSYFGAFWAAPLVTDTCIFTLTLLRLIKYRRGNVKIPLMEQIFRDGVLYFFLIFCGNLLNAILFWTAPDDLTALGASFTHVMTSLMVCRLQLNLRKARREDGVYRQSGSAGKFSGHRQEPSGDVQTFFSVGNLGEDMESWSAEDRRRTGRSFDEGRNTSRARTNNATAVRQDVEASGADKAWTGTTQSFPLKPLNPFD